MLADIATGHTWGADVCFLIAVILAGIAALAPLWPAADPNRPPGSMAGWAAVAVLSLGFLLL